MEKGFWVKDKRKLIRNYIQGGSFRCWETLILGDNLVLLCLEFFLFDVRYDVLALLPLDLLYLKFGRQCTLLRYFKGMWWAFTKCHFLPDVQGFSLTGPLIFNTEKEIRPTHNCAHLRLNYQKNMTTASGKEAGGGLWGWQEEKLDRQGTSSQYQYCYLYLVIWYLLFVSSTNSIQIVRR